MPRVRQRPRSGVTDRPSRRRLLLRRLRRLVRPGAVVGGILLLVLGLRLIAGLSAAAGSVGGWRESFGQIGAALGLRIGHVVIEGDKTTPRPLLDAAIGVFPGDPILGFSVAAARARILTLASVRRVVVERALPATVIVRLTERRPFAIWQHDGKFSVIDRHGRVLAHHDVAATLRQTGMLPLVVGTGAPDHVARLFADLAQYPEIAARVAAAVRVGQRRWNLLLKSKTTVELPARSLDSALAHLRRFQTRIALLDRLVAVIDLRLADRIVVRPFPAPATKKPPAPAGALHSARAAHRRAA